MSSIENYNAKPEGLSEAGEKAYQTIMNVLTKNSALDTGGCKTFYSPAEWKDREEDYGLESELIVVYDGGDVGPFFGYEYGDTAAEVMEAALHSAGLWSEPCTNWYSAIYKL